MMFLVDENVSYEVAVRLRNAGHDVEHIDDLVEKGMSDADVYNLCAWRNATLVTRDHHFTNSYRYPPETLRGILYLRRKT